MAKPHINDLTGLELAIARQKLRILQLEDEMDRHWEHFQHRYPGMIINSLLASRKPSGEPAAKLVNQLLQNEKVKSILDSLVDQIADKAADRVREVVSKWKK